MPNQIIVTQPNLVHLTTSIHLTIGIKCMELVVFRRWSKLGRVVIYDIRITLSFWSVVTVIKSHFDVIILTTQMMTILISECYDLTVSNN